MVNLFKAFLITMVCSAVIGCKPEKMTYPTQSGLNPHEFRFSNYRGHEELVPIFREIFPIGVPRHYVNEIFVVNNGSTNHSGLISELKSNLEVNPTLGFGWGKATDQKILSLNPHSYNVYTGQGDGGYKYQWKVVAFFGSDNTLIEIVARHRLVHHAD